MATTDSIKIKNGNTTNTINLIKYKSGNSVKTINSVWYVKNGNKNLVWPKSYDAHLTIVPTYSGDITEIPASGGEVTLKYYFTVYYPNTNIPVTFGGTTYDNLEVTNDADPNNWLSIVNWRTDQEIPNTSGSTKSRIILEHRSRNGLPTSTGPDDQQIPSTDQYGDIVYPFSDGYWIYTITGYKDVIINTIHATASATLELRQRRNYIRKTGNKSINTPYWYSTSTGSELYYYNNYQNGSYSSLNTLQNPASYQGGTIVYSRINWKVNAEYEFTSGVSYIVKHYPTEFNTPTSSESWATVTNSNNNWHVTLEENTTSDNRSTTIRVSINGIIHSYTIYQAGNSNAATNP